MKEETSGVERAEDEVGCVALAAVVRSDWHGVAVRTVVMKVSSVHSVKRRVFKYATKRCATMAGSCLLQLS